MVGAGLAVAAAGVFSICGAIYDWDWFFDSYKARPIVKIIGRSAARGFYGILGAAIVVGGIALMFAK